MAERHGTLLSHHSVTLRRGFNIYYRKAEKAGRLGTDTRQVVLAGSKQQQTTTGDGDEGARLETF